MPIYEYVCQNCGEPLERLQKLSDDPLTDCPACGESSLKRKISAAGFRLSGGGWYETDFKSDGKRNLTGGSESSSKSSSGGESSAKQKKGDASTKSEAGKSSDNKPAAKPATKSSSSSD